MTEQIATLAGGCFWCLETAYHRLRGVREAISGYMGGSVDHPSYELVCHGDSGHAEVVQIRFDATAISYRDLLEVFFTLHDPTTPNRQGNDIGTQYRSAVFWHSPEQRAAAEAMIAELDAAGVFGRPIVTQVVPAATFWPAEDEHQRYYERHPYQPYCQHVIAPKLAKLRARHARILQAGADA